MVVPGLWDTQTEELDAALSALITAADGVGALLVALHWVQGTARIAFASPGLLALTGRSSAEVKGAPWTEIMTPEAQPGWSAWLDSVGKPGVRADESGKSGLGEGCSPKFDTLLVCRNREPAPVQVSWCLKEVQGTRYWVGFCKELEAVRRLENELFGSQERFRTLLETVPVAVWILDQYQLYYANPACLRLLGYPTGISRSRKIDPRILMHPDDVANFERRLHSLLVLGHRVPPQVYRVNRGGGEVCVLEVCSRAGEYEGRAVAFCFGRAITLRPPVEHHLRRVDRLGALGLLAGGMAHAINNPLTYVILNLEHVAQRLGAQPYPALLPDAPLTSPSSEERAELSTRLEEARSGAERVAAVVRHMRALSRPNDHEMALVDLRQLLEELLELLGNEIRHRGHLVTDLAAVAPVLANPSELEHVFLNLLIHATHALPEQSGSDEIKISLCQKDSAQVVVEIAICGQDSWVKDWFRGTGPMSSDLGHGERVSLDLSLSHSILNSLGGSLVMSQEPGRTCFQVTLMANSSS